MLLLARRNRFIYLTYRIKDCFFFLTDVPTISHLMFYFPFFLSFFQCVVPGLILPLSLMLQAVFDFRTSAVVWPLFKTWLVSSSYLEATPVLLWWYTRRVQTKSSALIVTLTDALSWMLLAEFGILGEEPERDMRFRILTEIFCVTIHAKTRWWL